VTPSHALLQTWTDQLQSLLPQERLSRLRTLAVFSLGMMGAETVRLHRVAAALPLPARVPSTERRLQRFLANDRVEVVTLWQPLLPHLLAGWAGREATLVFDPTPCGTTGTILWVGIVWQSRVLPLAWQHVPQQQAWPASLPVLLEGLLAPIAAAMPPGCTATLIADRGVSGPGMLDVARKLGWEVVLRLNVGAQQAHRLRLADGREVRLGDWLAQAGRRWRGVVHLFKAAGWREGHLTIHRAHGAAEPWVLFSSRPAGLARVREYRLRVRVEATFADTKRRGWGLEQSRVRQAAHVERLLLVWHLALWWLYVLGLHVIRAGQRARFDRTHRRERSLLRLGWLWLRDRLHHGALPHLLFRSTLAGWIARGTPVPKLSG
jgi:hypothetical protein